MKKATDRANIVTAILFMAVMLVFFAGTVPDAGKAVKDIIKNEAVRPGIAFNDLASFFGLVEKNIENIEAAFDDSLFLKEPLIDINGGVHLLLNQKIVEDADKTWTAYKLSNGQLTFNNRNRLESIPENVASMKELYDYLTGKGMKILYVQAPHKINKYDSQLPYNMDTMLNANADEFLKGLRDENVPYLDLREVIRNELESRGQADKTGILAGITGTSDGSGASVTTGTSAATGTSAGTKTSAGIMDNSAPFEYGSLFYNTDHHWRIETAFWAYGRVLEALRELYGFEYAEKMTDPACFREISMEKSFLGSIGRRVGRIYGGVDDFSLLLPDFQTQYHMRVYTDDGLLYREAEGNFDDVIVSREFLENKDIKTNRYTAYFGGDYPLVEIENKSVDKGRLLVLKDSFGIPFSAFMSLSFRETDVIDLRHIRYRTLFEHLEENWYDYVVFLYNPGFDPKLFDFR